MLNVFLIVLIAVCAVNGLYANRISQFKDISLN